jgi:hypothetical protein
MKLVFRINPFLVEIHRLDKLLQALAPLERWVAPPAWLFVKPSAKRPPPPPWLVQMQPSESEICVRCSSDFKAHREARACSGFIPSSAVM